MDFGFEKKYDMAKTLFKEFTENEVEPLAQEIDENEAFPKATVEKMAKYGFLGIPVSKENGGQGCDYLTYVLCVEELAKKCGSTAAVLTAHTVVANDVVFEYGTPAQKEAYGAALAKGEKLGAAAILDADGKAVTAELVDDEYVLNGTKNYVLNGEAADVFVVTAVTGMIEKNGRQKPEVSAFLIDKETAGLTVGAKQRTLGTKGAGTCPVTFDGCRVPQTSLLSAKGKGDVVLNHILDCARIGVAAQALGIAEGALDKTSNYVQERKQFGVPIGFFQNTRAQLAEMSANIEAARLLVYKAAVARATARTYSQEAATAKLIAARTATSVTREAVQLHGGYGYMREYDVERMMRDAKAAEVHEGSAEAQLMTIFRSAMK